jgi:HEAT repeat protein
MPPNSFKNDESFLKKLAVGATGTKAAIRHLSLIGFQPIELERGSSGFKIWKTIKIKRIRVPDILCLKSGWRFESRGKTKLEISMSHSKSDPNRAWDAGMRADDFVVVVLCEQASESIVDWQPASPLHFIRVDAMRAAYNRGAVKVTAPKGVEEGSEIRVIWPSVAAHDTSVVSDVTATAIKLSPVSEGRPQRCVLARSTPLIPLCQIGETVSRNQVVAAVVPAVLDLTCPADVGEPYFVDKLSSAALSERYAAAKALRFRGHTSAVLALSSRIADDVEDIYVKLEAAAALAAHGFNNGWDYLELSLSSDYAQVQLETIIVLSEISSPRSQALLIGALADSSRQEEIRAGAAWALGEFRTDDAARALADTFDHTSLDIKVEAARALLRIAPDRIPLLLALIRSSPESSRDGLAWVLAKTGTFDPAEIVLGPTDDNLRRWAGYVLGYGRGRFLDASVEAVCHDDPEVYFAASVLWQLLSSWIHDLKEY